jgi:hypothetical protein
VFEGGEQLVMRSEEFHARGLRGGGRGVGVGVIVSGLLIERREGSHTVGQEGGSTTLW